MGVSWMDPVSAPVWLSACPNGGVSGAICSAVLSKIEPVQVIFQSPASALVNFARKLVCSVGGWI